MLKTLKKILIFVPVKTSCIVPVENTRIVPIEQIRIFAQTACLRFEEAVPISHWLKVVVLASRYW